MHASIRRFTGDADELLRRYDAMVAEIPAANLRLHMTASRWLQQPGVLQTPAQ
jgi:hypothetical protein